MKKKLLTITSCLILSTTLLVGCNVKFGVNSRRNMYNNNTTNSEFYEETLNDAISMDNVEILNISIYASDITIKSIEGNDFTLNCSGPSQMVKNTVFEKKNNTLTIEENGNVSGMDFSSFKTSYGRKVVIGIPKTYNNDIIISSGAGIINIDSIICNSLDIKGGAGELTINDIIFKDLKLEQGVGSTFISLKDKSGNMNVSGGIGEIHIKLSDVGGDLTYSGGIGETTLDIPDNSPVKINTKSGLGSSNVNVKTSGDDTYIFDLSIGIGSLDIN